MNARREAATYAKTLGHLITRVPVGYRLCLLERTLVLVPDELAERCPTSLTERERSRVLTVGDVGLSEAP